MNIYHAINEIILYIENHLDEQISYQKLAKIAGLNEQILHSVFSLITNVGLAEYIRNRRLSKAAEDLKKGISVMDVAIKYQYTSAVAFSRVFTKFHGVKPSEVKRKKIKVKNYPVLCFANDNFNISYRIEKKKAFSLYGLKKETDEYDIASDAPKFYTEVKKKYQKVYGNIEYGMVKYEKRFTSDYLEYWCLYSIQHDELIKIEIPSLKWLIFTCNSWKAREIQYLIHKVYDDFLPKNNYALLDYPELEHYLEDGSMEFMLPIE